MTTSVDAFWTAVPFGLPATDGGEGVGPSTVQGFPRTDFSAPCATAHTESQRNKSRAMEGQTDPRPPQRRGTVPPGSA